MKHATSPLILVDGSSYFYRAFHALPPLTNSKGQPTGAVYGVANMIKRLIKDYQPQRIAVVFDAKGKTFRDDWFPAYKANRAAMPDDLRSQFEPLLQLLRAMGLPLLIVENVEADDVIGTLAHLARQQNIPVVISTGDKDMAQLVNDHVTLINTMSNQILDHEGVKSKFGVEPQQIIDYLTLVGDTSDNIPGVPKCGPKTAIKWLSQFQTLDALLENTHTIEGKIGESLRASVPHLPLSKKLVTIKTDVELPLTLADLVLQTIDHNQMIELTREFEFKTWLKELLGSTLPSSPAEPIVVDKQPDVATSHLKGMDLITTKDRLQYWIEKIQSCSHFCVTTETTDSDAINAEIVGIAIAIDSAPPVYIPLAHDEGEQLNREDVLSILRPILENPMIGKIGQNLKFEYNVFKNYGIYLQGITSDVMLVSYLLNSATGRHDVETLALKYLGHSTMDQKDLVGSGTKRLNFNQVSIEHAAPYAIEKAEIILKLHQTLYPLMDEKLRKVFHDIEMPLLSVLADIERHGVLIDKATLLKHGERLKLRMATLHEEAVRLAGRDFNLNSPKQLQEILYQEQNLPILTKTPTGQPSTAESVLQELALAYPLPAVILEYRSLNKLVSTYIDALPKRINPITQRVHTSYNQAVTATGRLSSSEPNLQNIPTRSEEGRLIRKAFIAPKHHVLIAADYSQIELRIMAHLSQDPGLLKAFANGWDIHDATASELFAVELSQVNSEHRRRAKAINFGLIYGMSSFGLAKQLDVERKDAQQYIDCYFQRYPGVLDYMERTRRLAHQQGYVETLFGRRLYLPEINVRNVMRQKAAERAAINAPMQGTAADIIKKAMLAIAEWQSKQAQPDLRMIMQVHDELVFEVHEKALEPAQEIIRKLMEHTVELSVPLVISMGQGFDWDAAH